MQGRYFDSMASARLLDVLSAMLAAQPGTTVAQLDFRIRRRFPALYRPDTPERFPLGGLDRVRLLLGANLRASTTSSIERDGKTYLVEEKPWEEMDRIEPNGPGFISLASLGAQTIRKVNGREAKEGAKETEEGEDAPPAKEVEKGDRRNFEHEIDTDDLSTLSVHFMRSLAVSARTENDPALKRTRAATISRTAPAPSSTTTPAQGGSKRKADAEIIEVDEPARQTRSTTSKKKAAAAKRGKRK